jgi:hypothetical protein
MSDFEHLIWHFDVAILNTAQDGLFDCDLLRVRHDIKRVDMASVQEFRNNLQKPHYLIATPLNFMQVS